MTLVTTETVLSHWGKKGMKWGVRKAVRSPEQFKKDLLSDPSPKNVDIPVHKDDHPAGDGISSKGHFYQKYVTSDDYLYVKYSNGDKGYQSDGPGESNTRLKLMSMTGKDLTHSDMDSELVLAHWGKKGMKWGVRKSITETVRPTSPEDVKLKVTPGKRVVAVSGGRAHPPSQDAKAAAAYAQIARKSSSSALSNKELQAVVTRMKLEQEWSKVLTGDKEKNRTVFKKIFDKYKDNEINKIAQGKTPTTILLAQALNNAARPSAGRHVKR